MRRPEVEAGGASGEGTAARKGYAPGSPSPASPETSIMTPTTPPSPPRAARPARPPRTTTGERVFVLAGIGAASLYTIGSLALGAGTETIGPLWLAAVAWTALASLAGALDRGLRRRDWSSFRGHRFPDDGGELDEWASRTGRYEWLGDLEDRPRDGDPPH